MHNRALRLLIAAAVVLTTALAGVTAAVDAAAKRVCNGQPTSAGGGWLAFKPSGLSSQATLVEAVPYMPDRIYATDNTTLTRTDDGGCTWSALTLPTVTIGGVSLLTQPVSITSISAPSSATSTGYLYVGAQAGAASQVGQPYVFASPDGGANWKASNSGLPALGKVVTVAASDISPTIAYAVVTDASGQSGGVYFSNDGGMTWALKSPAMPTSLRVNPVVPTQLFGVFAGVGLEVSSDAGATFHPVGRTQPNASYDVAPGAGYIQIVQGYPSAKRFDRSFDGGQAWLSHTSPVAVTGGRIAVSPVADAVLVGDDRDLWINATDPTCTSTTTITSTGRRTTLCPETLHPVNPAIGIPTNLQMSAPTSVGLSVTGLESNGLVVRLIYNINTNKVVQQGLTPVRLLPSVSVKQFPSSLFPLTNTVKLAAGASTEVPYRLLLPRTPSPVDLMFLVDTTASTDRTLNAVRQDLGRVVDELGSIGLDAQFGVADFRDYSSDDLGNGESGDYPYRLRRAIGPVNSALRAALNGLHSGGGGDSDEADLTALYQSTLGTGQYVTDVDGHHVRVVRAGQQAGYRSDSLRLAIIATDAAYHKEASYPTPSWASTVAALRAHGVHQVGLAVQTVLLDGTPTGFDSKHDEQLMARDTGALAPFGGVDCDGNGTVDVAQGAPLVCPIPQPKSQQTTIAGKVTVGPPPAPLHLANAIVDLAANIPDLRAVGLQVHGGPASLASVVSTPGAPTVNVRADNTLSYTVRFTCPVAVTGKNYSLTLDAVAGVRTVTSASTDLQCGGQPKPGVIPPVAPIAAAAVAAAPGGPPNPPAQGNANPNPNPALNANAGFAQQEDEEKQLAFADADQGAALDDENAMAMSRRPSTAEEAWMAGAAGMMMAGAGYATRRRWRTAYNRG